MPWLVRECVGFRERAFVEIKTKTTGVGDDDVRNIGTAVVDGKSCRCCLFDAISDI